MIDEVVHLAPRSVFALTNEETQRQKSSNGTTRVAVVAARRDAALWPVRVRPQTPDEGTMSRPFARGGDDRRELLVQQQSRTAASGR